MKKMLFEERKKLRPPPCSIKFMIWGVEKGRIATRPLTGGREGQGKKSEIVLDETGRTRKKKKNGKGPCCGKLPSRSDTSNSAKKYLKKNLMRLEKRSRSQSQKDECKALVWSKVEDGGNKVERSK